MSRYESASYVFYQCLYHLVWTPKYRYKIFKGNLGKGLYRSLYIRYQDKIAKEEEER